MRLRPRARFSDLDEARSIAQRLERGGTAPDVTPDQPGPYVSFAPARPAEAEPVERAADEPTPVEPTPIEPAPVEAEPASDIDRPSETGPPVPEPVWQAEPWSEPEPGAGEAPGAESETVSDLVSVSGGGGEDDVSSAAGPGEDTVPSAEAYDAVVTMPPGPPSEGPSLETLLLAAQAAAGVVAAMLIAPDGEPIASCGDWPAVGPAKIAGKLLPLVRSKLDAPGAIVPVKMAGQVLTAWRVELDARPITVAMLAPQAVSAAVRDEVDAQLVQGGA